jgi:hypothetical protein
MRKNTLALPPTSQSRTTQDLLLCTFLSLFFLIEESRKTIPSRMRSSLEGRA